MALRADDTLLTITFLCTDIAGSTQHWQEDREKMRARLAQHDHFTQEIITRHGGDLFKTRGDGVFSAFTSAPAACAAATALQRALYGAFGTDFLVRTVLHSGEVQYRDGDYFGLALSRVARMLEIAHGGQLLLSATTARLLEEAEPQASEHLLELGPHQLRSFAQREHLFQLLAEGLPSSFPPLACTTLPPHNLPRTLTTFIGREREVMEAEHRLKNTRLLTILGAGGNGKTRLSLQVAQELLPHFSGGVWFVDLAPLSDPTLVARTTVLAVSAKEESGLEPVRALIHHLSSLPHLVILDNCEHVIDAVAALVEQLLIACPELTILATSREALEVSGEVVWPLAGLTLPTTERGGIKRLLRYEAIRLFMERATAVEPTFSLTTANAATVIRICQRLDGMPLAIELAAAWANVLSLEQIESHLSDRFQFLTRGGRRTSEPRHQTLRATLEWSHQLLTESERLLWRRLSVFTGGATLEGVQHVCTDHLLSIAHVLGALYGLVRKSLVVHETLGREDRYRQLETIREYGLEQLEAAGESDALRKQHLAFFAQLVAEAEPHLRGAEQTQWLDRLEREHDNIRVALQHAQEGEVALRLATALVWFWRIRGHFTEGNQRLEELLARFPEASTALIADALVAQGAITMDNNTETAERSFYRALSLFRENKNVEKELIVLANLGTIAFEKDDFESGRRLAEEALALYRKKSNKRSLAAVLLNLSAAEIQLGLLDSAFQHLEESRQLFEEIDDSLGMSFAYSNQSYILEQKKDYRGALLLLLHSLAFQIKMNDKIEMIRLLCHLLTILDILKLPSSFLSEICLKLEDWIGNEKSPLDNREQDKYTEISNRLSIEKDLRRGDPPPPYLDNARWLEQLKDQIETHVV